MSDVDEQAVMSEKADAQRESDEVSLALVRASRAAAEGTCERLRELLTEALNMLDGYIMHRADMLEHIAATCEDDTVLADTERAQQAVTRDQAEAERIREKAETP